MRIEMMTDEDRLNAERLDQFERLLGRADGLMKQHGRHDSLSQLGDYLMVDDYWGYPQLKISIHELALLHPRIVKGLQKIVRDFPGWEIVYTVAVRGHYYDWPDMGLYIRPHEIFDTLQRRYFPEEFRKFEYRGSRRGTEAEAAAEFNGTY